MDFHPFATWSPAAQSFITISQGRAGHPQLLPTSAFFFFLTPCHPEQSQLKNSLMSPPSTPLITNSAESWITQNKRQIYLPRDINKIIRNKHSGALSSWENFNGLTPCLTEIWFFPHNYKTPRVSPVWVICWHTFTILASCSHWPILSISAGALNQALPRQRRKPERNYLFLVKFPFPIADYLGWPGYANGSREEATLPWLSVTNHLTSHEKDMNQNKGNARAPGTKKSPIKPRWGTAQFSGFKHVTGLSLSAHASPVFLS